MSQVMQPHPAELRIRADRPPTSDKAVMTPTVGIFRKHEAIRNPISGQRLDQRPGGLAERHGARAGLGVGQVDGSRAGAGYVNAGALGRPANDGRTCVWYATLSTDADRLEVEHVPVRYDHEALAREMAREGICEEFVTTIRTGWWTTCLEILPGKERARGRY